MSSLSSKNGKGNASFCWKLSTDPWLTWVGVNLGVGVEEVACIVRVEPFYCSVIYTGYAK